MAQEFVNMAPVMLTNGLANAISGAEGASGGESSSWSEGGSANSAQSVSGSQGTSQGTSWSNVAGIEASTNSAQEAQRAHERQKNYSKWRKNITPEKRKNKETGKPIWQIQFTQDQ